MDKISRNLTIYDLSPDQEIIIRSWLLGKMVTMAEIARTLHITRSAAIHVVGNVAKQWVVEGKLKFV